MSNWEPYMHTAVQGVPTTLTQLYPSGDGPSGPRIFGITANNDFFINLSDDGSGPHIYIEASGQGPFWICADDVTRLWVKANGGTMNFMVISYGPNQVFPGR